MNPLISMRLFCFAYAGGGASVYRSWGELFPPWIELRPVQLPGHENRAAEPLLTNIRAMADHAAAELEPYFDIPYALFGHSMGALVAYELTRVNRVRGTRLPAVLMVSGHRAPHLPLRRQLLYNLRAPELRQALLAMNGTPRAVLDDPELFEFFQPVLRADFEACDCYAPADDEPVDVPIVAFAGVDDGTEPLADVREWRQHTRASFELRTFPGGHFFIHNQRAAVVDAIVRAMHSTDPASNRKENRS